MPSPIEQLNKRPHSRVLAIKAMCYECMGSGADKGWQRAIKHCTISECPLWRFRPYRAKTSSEG